MTEQISPWIETIKPNFIPTWTIGKVVLYPTNLKVRAIVEVPECGNLLMASCDYITDSPALLEPDLSNQRIFIPWNNQHINDELTIETSFKVTTVEKKQTPFGLLYSYTLESTGDQLVLSAKGNRFLQYASGFENYAPFLCQMTPSVFVVIAQGIEDFTGVSV